MKKRKNRESGQSLVEFALLLPLLLVVLCGIIDFGWIYSNQVIVEFGARDGARYAAINSSSSDLSNLVKTRVQANAAVAKPANLTVTTKITGSDVSVKVDYPLTLLTPIISTFVGNPYTVSSTCVMKTE